MGEITTVIVGLATSVLKDIIVNLVNGKSKAARRQEIETEVAKQLLHHGYSQREEELRRLRATVVQEIEVLARRNSELVVLTGSIELKAATGSRQIARWRSTEALHLQLEKMDQIVAVRRAELGLSLLEVFDRNASPPTQEEVNQSDPGNFSSAADESARADVVQIIGSGASSSYRRADGGAETMPWQLVDESEIPYRDASASDQLPVEHSTAEHCWDQELVDMQLRIRKRRQA